MADAFRTTNEITYTWHDHRNPSKSSKQADQVYADAPDADIWIASDASSDSDQISAKSSEELQRFIKKLYGNRNHTVYQVSYCAKQLQARTGSQPELKLPENELLEYGKLLFSEPTQRILKPLPSSRKVYGYIRPRSMYTGLTQYQHTISRYGYQILNDNYQRIEGYVPNMQQQQQKKKKQAKQQQT